MLGIAALGSRLKRSFEDGNAATPNTLRQVAIEPATTVSKKPVTCARRNTVKGRRSRVGLLVIMALVAAFSLRCGGGSHAIAISPSSAAIFTGQTAQFSVKVTGVSNGLVTWYVNGTAGGGATTGTITATGLYTAPSVITPAVFEVKATSNSDPSLSAYATISVFLTGTVSSAKNTQVAQYSIATLPGAQVFVQFGPDTSYGLKTWSVPAPQAGGLVNILVAGMRASSTYHMRAVVQLADGTTLLDGDHTFATGSLTASQMPAITTATTTGMTPNGGVELLDLVPFGATVGVAATDLDGSVIWYYDGIPAGLGAQPVKLLPDGNMLVNYASSQVDGESSVLQEVDLAGNVVWQRTAADLNQALAAAGYKITVVGTHHDVAILPNGHLIVIASTIQDFTDLPGYPGTTAVTGDLLVDLDQDRKPVWVWSEFDHLDVRRHPMSFPDWTHTNAVLYSPDDGDLVISVRHQFWLIKIDYQNGAGTGGIVWKLGWQGDFALQDGTDPVDWFYAQHGPSLVSSDIGGRFSLILFDNGNNRPNNGTPCGTNPGSPCQSRVPALQIDETAKTATILWVDKLPVFSAFGGNAEPLPNGNVEFDECAATFTPPSAAVYEVTQETTPQTVWQMQITGQFAYRAFRIPSLYPGVQW